MSPHREQAQRLESQGDLQGALNEWKVALTIDPKDDISIQGKKRIEERINQAVADALSRGRDALKRRVNVEARRYFLMVLALDPSNKAAFDACGRAREVTLNHTVRSGESLTSIAEFYYGDRSRSEILGDKPTPGKSETYARNDFKIPEVPGVPFARRVPRETRSAGPSPPEAAKGEAVEEEEVYVNPMLADAREAFERGDCHPPSPM